MIQICRFSSQWELPLNIAQIVRKTTQANKTNQTNKQKTDGTRQDQEQLLLSDDHKLPK